MNSVTITLNQTCNPFSINAPVNLVNISSGKAANEETKKFLLETLEQGRKLRLQFVGECLVDGSRFLKPVARTKVFNFAAENMKQSKKKRSGKLMQQREFGMSLDELLPRLVMHLTYVMFLAILSQRYLFL